MASRKDGISIRPRTVSLPKFPNRPIRSEAVLDALRSVPRHEFVPSTYRDLAYDDIPLPIGFRQTISQPYMVGIMTELLDLKPGDRVLEIGTGSGYQAAVLSHLTDEVFSTEVIRPLALRAFRTLRRQECSAVRVRHCDGFYGWPEAAPFQAIVMTCAASDPPGPLRHQLADGGAW